MGRVSLIAFVAIFVSLSGWAHAQFDPTDAPAPVTPPQASMTDLPQSMKTGDWDTYSDTWGATDALGRSVPDNSQTGNPRADKFIGMFCFMANDAPGTKVYDNTELLGGNYDQPAPGPPGTNHWWGQPWFGYYISSDPAVIRKHVQMLADAGVDVMIYDNTNGPTYPNVREKICQVLTQMRAEGLKTPQIAFFCGQNAWNDVYHDFYLQNKYPDLWFRWQGKPLMLVHLDGAQTVPPEVSNFFTIKESWAWSSGDWFKDGHDKWSWLDNYPQKFGWSTDPKTPEETSACAAQHATTSIGRSSHSQQEPPLAEVQSEAGICFAQQLKQALKIDPEFLFVTGWDEWTATCFVAPAAGRFADRPQKAGEFFYVDEYDPEFSRDIEPVQGSLQDNYYYQFVAAARRYKGVRAVAPIQPKPIVWEDFSSWKDVQPEFRDDIGDPVHRDSPGWGTNHYVNQTGRNDLMLAKVSYDSRYIYFYMRTKDDITPASDPNWMLLYIDTDNDPTTGWLGYDYVVNRVDVGNGITTIQKNVDGKYNWKTVAKARYFVRNNELEIVIPRSVLGLDFLPAQINFKWADNIQQTGDVSDFSINGDAAPNDRFYYQAKFGH